MWDAERLSAHTRALLQVEDGDYVHIQNQIGPHPTKWDKAGMIIEVRQFDQYVVRVDGSGRVTPRNRKLVRRYIPVILRFPRASLPSPTATMSKSISMVPPTRREPAPQAQAMNRSALQVRHNLELHLITILNQRMTAPLTFQ